MAYGKRVWTNKDGTVSEAWQSYNCYGKLRLRFLHPTRRAAKAFDAQIVSEIVNGTFIPEFYQKTVRDVVEDMVASMKKKKESGIIPPSTFRQVRGVGYNYVLGDRSRYEVEGKRHLLDRMIPWCEDDGIGSYKLHKVQAPLLNKLLEDLRSRGASFELRTRVRSVIAIIFDWAINTLGWARENPAEKVSVVKTKADYKPKMKIIEGGHLDLLMHVATPLQRLLLQCTALTGVRVGELLALQWGNIDSLNNIIHVEATINEDRERVRPKSESGFGRPVIMSDYLAEALEAARFESPYCEDEDPVFAYLDGKHYYHKPFYEDLVTPLFDAAEKELAENPGLWPDLPKDISIGKMRHLAISTWLDAELPEIVVWQMAGHSGPESIRKRYGHIIHSQEKVEKLNAVSERYFGKREPQADHAQ